MGYKVHLNGANALLLDHILPFSTILEFGSASGEMTHFLQETLHCEVYIVEKNPVSFRQAIKYAKEGICDNILSLSWVDKFSQIKFDYVLFSNVLEHITDPDLVLEKVIHLLKDSGTILVSVPNIAHNDVLLNMYNDTFNYTEEGLLDQTHVRFWGYKNLTPFFKKCGFKIVDFQTVSIKTLETEQCTNSIPYNFSFYEDLKSRDLGEIYQFVLALQKENAPSTVLDNLSSNVYNNTYATIYLDYGNGFSENNTLHMLLKPVCKDEYTLDYIFKCPRNICAFRFDPMEGEFCIVRNFNILSNVGEVTLSQTNALFANDTYYFCNTDSQMIFTADFDNVVWIKIQANIIPLKTYHAQNLLIQLVRQIELNKAYSNNYEVLENKFRNNLEYIENVKNDIIAFEKSKNDQISRDFKSNADITETNHLLLQDICNKTKRLFDIQENTDLLMDNIEKKINIFHHNIENISSELLESLSEKQKKINRIARILEEKELEQSQNLALISNQSQKLTEQTNYIQNLENYIHILKNSTCWKITKPIRFIGDIKKNLLTSKSESVDSDEVCIYNIEHYSLENDILKVAGWIAAKEKVGEESVIIFAEKGTRLLKGSLPLTLIERKDVISTFAGKYSFVKGFYIEASLKTGEELDVSLSFKIGNSNYLISLPPISSMLNVSKFQCMISSQSRGNTALNCMVSLFDQQGITLYDNIYKETFDIIVPIFNGFEFFDGLFGSLEKTNCRYRLILINDCSTDKRIEKYILRYQATHDDIIIINNPNNLGFVQSVNKGLELSRNHVVLLNTDVVLPDCWLERLMLPLLEDPHIATTTPFTNSGTICSFPFFGKDNQIDSNYMVDDIDKYFKKLLPNYVTMPTGVGFCMGINKKALEAVGLLDAETFSKGYGEENDWCQRAIKLGYRNIHVNNLFVYHKHGGSFLSEEKKALLERNSKLLNQRYPTYSSEVAAYCAMDPLRETREAVLALFILLECPGKNILAFNHILGGGASQYLKEKRQLSLKKGEKFIVIEYEVNSSTYTIHLWYENYTLTFSAFTYQDIHNFIMHMPISEVWINELVSYPNIYDIFDSLTTIKRTKELTYVMLLHDLFCICPAINMIDNEGMFCDFPCIDKCEECAKSNARNHYPNWGNIRKYRNKWRVFLTECDHIIAFSNNTAELFKKVYGPLKSLKIIPHQIEGLPKLKKHFKTTTTFNIGILGVLNNHKGYQIIKDMLYLIERNHLNMKIILIGYCEEHIDSPFFYSTGIYNREALPKLVSMLDIDIFFISSIWPETFSYTTAEIMSLNYPIASFNLGAPADRIANYAKGLIIDTMTASSALNALWSYYTKTLNIPISSHKVLFLIEEVSFASRYRVEHVQEQLFYQGISSDIVNVSEIDSLLLAQYKKIVVYRVSDYKAISALKLQANKLGIPLAYDIDDFIFDYKQICSLSFLFKEEYWDFESYCNNIQKTMLLCDSYITSTETLKAAISTSPLFLEKQVIVKRNMASVEMFLLSNHAYRNKMLSNDNSSQIWLGYFSGSKTHDADFSVIADVVLQLMEKYSNLYLKIGGCLELPSTFDKYRDRVSSFPFKDWKELPEEIASVDINLMPLEATFFNQCKSENKWMEAGLVRVPTVASYNDELALIINGENGFLCHSRQEWYKNLSLLIESANLRKLIGERAYQDVQKSYVTLDFCEC